MAIVERGRIKSSRDLIRLGIIDWNRLNNYWENIDEASVSIASWLEGAGAMYSIVDHDMAKSPDRDDWPGWKHIGLHPEMGKMYWNYFHQFHNGTLHFSDSPDFRGTLHFKDGAIARFWGDIGQVSASTFMHTIRMLGVNDIWISVVDNRKQILIESQISIYKLWNDWFSAVVHDRPMNETKAYEQLRLF